MKLPDTIRRMLFTAALAVTILGTSTMTQLRAAAVDDTRFPAPLPEWKTPAQLKVWRAETTAKTLAKEAAARAAQVKVVASCSTPSGFYTGKPYMAESGSYAFKYRDYNPEMSRWTTVDPSGFPDGANNRVYAAVPTSEFDNNGLNVVATYSIASRTLTIDGTHYTGCNSGDNNPDDQSSQNVGPIPIGSYNIFNRSGGIGRKAAFILDPNDGKTLNDQWDGQYNNRNNFRLHVGGAGSTIGCIVSNDIETIANQILGTTLNNTKLYKIDTGSASPGSPRYFNSCLYGSLNVTE